jgi:hypothetical protein
MLPGFRSLSVAILLGVSMLIFGLGAAALLRATHEEFASLPLKQLPEVTFGSREETQPPTLAVLQVDPRAADPAEPSLDQTEAQHVVMAAPSVQPESTASAPPAADAHPVADASPSAATGAATPAASPASSNSVLPPAANMAASADAAAAKPSEPPPGVETSVEAGDTAKPNVAKADTAKSDAPKSDVGASDVAETMTSPLGEHFRPPLPGSRPAQIAQAADPTAPAAKRSSTKPPAVAKRHRHRKVVRRSLRARSVAPNRAPLSASPFGLD